MTPRECNELYTESAEEGESRAQLLPRARVCGELNQAEPYAGRVDLVAVDVSTN